MRNEPGGTDAEAESAEAAEADEQDDDARDRPTEVRIEVEFPRDIPQGDGAPHRRPRHSMAATPSPGPAPQVPARSAHMGIPLPPLPESGFPHVVGDGGKERVHERHENPGRRAVPEPHIGPPTCEHTPRAGVHDLNHPVEEPVSFPRFVRAMLVGAGRRLPVDIRIADDGPHKPVLPHRRTTGRGGHGRLEVIRAHARSITVLRICVMA